ncbi:MAG: ribonucleoside-diphosphate reductase beta chain [Solirubrobacteraceae bacterium]|jgi:ribonucleoside-diphosphate reductase beta chain|nr:ribonucleoside-diphosphate reductase beta chain [Solirubrobacteraceae bacterium]
MASLLDLTTQGDVATISDESKLSQVQLMTPRQLYELWERQHWISHQIDFAQDRRDWEAMSDEVREDVSWGLANFFVGEERVATQFGGLVMAYDDQHEEAFLTTQQVDEARHAQHFNRLYDEVLQYDGTFEDRLDRCRDQLNDAYKVLFDELLVDANRALIENPRDVEAKIDFVVTYHMVIEGTLALTGQEFQTRWMESLAIMPGHLEGFRRVAQDEHRHVAYGTWYLQSKAGDPSHARRIQDRLMATLPAAAGVLVPPGYQLGDEYVFMGYSSQEMNEYAFTALSRRLKVIGVGFPAVAA